MTKQRILVIGGTGTIGTAVVKELSKRHEVVTAGHDHGDLLIDMGSESSIKEAFKKAGKLNAVVVTAGKVHFEGFNNMSAEKFQIGLNHKLMGQINIVRIGTEFVQDKGSFTLTSGILSKDPIFSGTSASAVNAAIDGFVIAAAIELPRGIRINSVSPTVVAESMDKYAAFFRGYEPVPVEKVALAYCKSVEGLQTGKTFPVGY